MVAGVLGCGAAALWATSRVIPSAIARRTFCRKFRRAFHQICADPEAAEATDMVTETATAAELVVPVVVTAEVTEAAAAAATEWALSALV